LRRTMIVLASLVLALVLFPGAAQAQYPPDQPTCVADRSKAAPGDPVSVTGDGWEPGGIVDIDFHQDNPSFDRDLGEVEANDAGTFVTTVEIPERAHGGSGVITFAGHDFEGNSDRCSVVLDIEGEAPAEVCLQVSDATVVRAQQIQAFSAAGCWQAGSQIRLIFLSDPVFVGQAEAAPDGSFSTTVTIPSDATLGDHLLRATGRDASGAPATRSVSLVVLGGRGLATTGIALWGLLLLAAALLVSGAGMLTAARALPGGIEHQVIRQEYERRARRARLSFAGAILSLVAWLVTASIHSGDPSGLSLSHPVSAGTVMLAALAAIAAWIGFQQRGER
jgi:hypothetical protein